MNGKESLFSQVTPESVGIPSTAILRFLETVEREQISMHSFLIVRHGQLVAEGYWAPYTADKLQRMYSISKSFVSLTIGLLAGEQKLSLDDRVATFFTDVTDESLHPYVARATIRDLLMMASPHARTTYTRHDEHFAATFFKKPPTHLPGTLFSYDTSATVVLCTIVEKIAGQPFLDYLRKQLEPITFSKDAWCIKTPEGTSWGGSGVLCTLRDLAKVAYVCLNEGRWEGQQLISEKYIQAATSKQIDNSLLGSAGYGYQIWRERNNGFSFRGMGSQFAFCFPDEGLLFACTADTQINGPSGERMVMQAFWDNIYAKIEDQPLKEDEDSLAILDEKLSSLSILPQQGRLTSTMMEKINEQWYELQSNPMHILRLRFIFDGDEGIFEYENDSGIQQIMFGLGKQRKGRFPLKQAFGRQLGKAKQGSYECIVSAGWVEEHKLNLLAYITDDYLGTAKMSFSFRSDEVSVHMVKAAEWFMEEYSGFASGVVK